MGADVSFCVHCRSDEDCPDCEAEAAPITKAAQVAAIRQRLGDIAAGATGIKDADVASMDNASFERFVSVASYIFSFDPFVADIPRRSQENAMKAGVPQLSLDSLAAWLACNHASVLRGGNGECGGSY